MDAYCLKSIRMVLARGPDCFLSPLSVSLLLNTPTTTRTHMCANTNSPRCVKMPQTKTHTREGICASTKTPASQLALALISPWKRIVFKQDAFSLFIVNRPKPYQLLITACQIHRLYGGPSGKKGKKKKRFSEKCSLVEIQNWTTINFFLHPRICLTATVTISICLKQFVVTH